MNFLQCEGGGFPSGYTNDALRCRKAGGTVDAERMVRRECADAL